MLEAMLVSACLLAALLIGSSNPEPQRKGQLLVAVVALRTLANKSTADLFPIAVIQNGKYRSANSIPYGEPPPPCELKATTNFYLFRNGSTVGSMNVEKVATKDTVVGSFRVGEGQWQINKAWMPSAPNKFVPGEEALAMSMYFRPDQEGIYAPTRVLVALNKPRKKGPVCFHSRPKKRLRSRQA